MLLLLLLLLLLVLLLLLLLLFPSPVASNVVRICSGWLKSEEENKSGMGELAEVDNDDHGSSAVLLLLEGLVLFNFVL